RAPAPVGGTGGGGGEAPAELEERVLDRARRGRGPPADAGAGGQEVDEGIGGVHDRESYHFRAGRPPRRATRTWRRELCYRAVRREDRMSLTRRLFLRSGLAAAGGGRARPAAP